MAEYWEEKPYYHRRDDTNYCQPILTLQDLEGILSSSDLRHPALELASNGSYFMPAAFYRPGFGSVQSTATPPEPTI
jgi:hypothetical protein